MKEFESINRGYNSIFKPNRLTIGLVTPIENYPLGSVASMSDHLKYAQLAEELGFKAIWVRDVPVYVPSFGDAGQTFDPFAYLAFLAGQTKNIALCTGSIALPLHHPIHVAKSAATIDQLSGGRMILGVASGDRPEEYPAMGIKFEERGMLFREAFDYIRNMQHPFPKLNSEPFGNLNGTNDVLPKATGQKIPMLVTGHSRQSIDWIGEHADGWMYYPRNLYMQEYNIQEWKKSIPENQSFDKPFMQPLYVDFQDDDDFTPQSIHLGFRIGANALLEFLKHLESLGVNHVAFNLRFNTNGIEQTLRKLANKVLTHFHK